MFTQEKDKTRLFEPMTIDALLAVVAFYYECQRSQCCESGPQTIKAFKSALDGLNIDKTNARAFAHGIGTSIIVLDTDPLNPLYKRAALLIVEALRRAGDITDEQIDQACERYKQAMAGRQAEVRSVMGEGLRTAKELFGRFPIGPGSARNN